MYILQVGTELSSDDYFEPTPNQTPIVVSDSDAGEV